MQKKGGEVLSLSAISCEVTALFKSGMSTTQLYSKFVEVGMLLLGSADQWRGVAKVRRR